MFFRGISLVAVIGGYSLAAALGLLMVGSRGSGARGLQSLRLAVSAVVLHQLSCFKAWWGLLGLEIEPTSPELASVLIHS